MSNLSPTKSQIQHVSNFQDLVSTPFQGEMNAICWQRELIGNFSEIVGQVEFNGNMAELDREELVELQLSRKGQLAREILLNDYKLLKEHGASPTLNLIKYYERDEAYPFFPTDVYSFHVDRSPIAVDTFLCTYHGDSSDILPNLQAEQKIHIPEIRAELKKRYGGPEAGFESFLEENFFDLHYEAKPDAQTISLDRGQMWKLAIDHPESLVPPCLHRAPKESSGETRLLMIC